MAESRPVHIPFLPGMHEEIDPAVIPQGALTRVENARQARDGGLVKRRGSTLFDCDSHVVQDLMPIDDVQGVGMYRGRVGLIAGDRVFDRDLRDGLGSSAWREAGRAPRYLPRRSHFIHFDDTVSSVNTPTAAMFGDRTAVTWNRGGDAVLVVLDRTGARIFTAVAPTRLNPRVVTVGAGWIWAYTRDSDVSIYVRSLNGTSLVLASETALLVRETTGDLFDVYPTALGTTMLIARRVDPTDMIVSRHPTTAPYSATDSHTVTVANSVINAIQIYEPPASATHIWVTWIDNAQDGWVSILNSALSSSSETQLDVGSNITQVALGGRSSVTTWLAYRNDSLDAVHVAQLNTAGIVNTHTSGLEGMKLLSRPHNGGTAGFNVWLQNHVYSSTNLFLSQMVLGRWYDVATGSHVLAVELIPDEKPGSVGSPAFQAPLCAPGNANQYDVSQDEGTPSLFPALITIKTQPAGAGSVVVPVGGDPTTTTAIIVYEYERTAAQATQYNGGDPMQIEEAAGAGIVYGGALQEITSSHSILDVTMLEPCGQENGFIVSPELSATLANSSSGGLTNGATYLGLACFEHVDADGRVTRSSPSNLASIVVNAAIKDIVWSWSVMPNTEREASSQYETTAVHVYVGGPNSSIFRRVTPDTSAPEARSDTSYTQIAETGATGIIYTLGGVKPNFPAPAHRHGCVALNRVWLFGLFNPRLVECSKFMVPNEPATFTRDPAFRSVCPLDVNCGVEMDGVIYALGPEGICTISPGQGPNNQGSPALPNGQILSRTGCISPGSLLRVPGGFMFEGRRGMYMLNRGGSEPTFIGASIAETWARTKPVNEDGGVVHGAALVRNRRSEYGLAETSAHLALTVIDPSDDSLSFEVACFDPEAGRFVGFDTGRNAYRIGSLAFDRVSLPEGGDALVTLPAHPLVAGAANTPQVDEFRFSAANYADYVGETSNTATYRPIELEATTGWIRPFGLMGHGDILEVALLVTVVDTAAIVYCEQARDGRVTREDPKPQALTDYVSGDLAVIRWPVGAGRDVNSIRLRFHDAAQGPAGGVGQPQPARVIYHGVTLMVIGAAGLPLQGTSRRVA